MGRENPHRKRKRTETVRKETADEPRPAHCNKAVRHSMAADVYWANDRTKYTAAQQTRTAHQPPVGEISVSELDNMAQKPKEYKCAVCGKPFEAFTDKSGKTWNAGQVYHMAERANTDGVARCRNCSTAAGTKKNA